MESNKKKSKDDNHKLEWNFLSPEDGAEESPEEDQLRNPSRAFCSKRMLNCSRNNRDTLNQRLSSWKKARGNLHQKHRNLEPPDEPVKHSNSHVKHDIAEFSSTKAKESPQGQQNANADSDKRSVDQEPGHPENGGSHGDADSHECDDHVQDKSDVGSEEESDTERYADGESDSRSSVYENEVDDDDDYRDNYARGGWVPNLLQNYLVSSWGKQEEEASRGDRYNARMKDVHRCVQQLRKSQVKMKKKLNSFNTSVTTRLDTFEYLLFELHNAYRLVMENGSHSSEIGAVGRAETAKMQSQSKPDMLDSSSNTSEKRPILRAKRQLRVINNTITDSASVRHLPGPSSRKSGTYLPEFVLNDNYSGVDWKPAREGCRTMNNGYKFPSISFQEICLRYVHTFCNSNGTERRAALLVRNSPPKRTKPEDCSRADTPESHQERHMYGSGCFDKGVKRKHDDMDTTPPLMNKKMRLHTDSETSLCASSSSGSQEGSESSDEDHSRICRRRRATDPAYFCIKSLHGVQGGEKREPEVKLRRSGGRARTLIRDSVCRACNCVACERKLNSAIKKAMLKMISREKGGRKQGSSGLFTTGKRVTQEQTKELFRRSMSGSTFCRKRRAQSSQKTAGRGSCSRRVRNVRKTAGRGSCSRRVKNVRKTARRSRRPRQRLATRRKRKPKRCARKPTRRRF